MTPQEIKEQFELGKLTALKVPFTTTDDRFYICFAKPKKHESWPEGSTIIENKEDIYNESNDVSCSPKSRTLIEKVFLQQLVA